MSDYDVRKAIRALKTHGCLSTLLEIAMVEGLPALSDSELKDLKDHMQFLYARRIKVWRTEYNKGTLVKDLEDSHVLNILRAHRHKSAYGGMYAFELSEMWQYIMLREATFRGLDWRGFLESE